MNTENESDFFGRTTGKHFTLNLSEDEQPNFGTEYIYADTETTAMNKISRVKNTLNGSVKSDYGYTYDNRGNILTVSKSGTLFQQYVYDEASQLKTEYNYAEKTAMTYVYDSNGNIVSKTPYTNVTSSDLSTATKGKVIAYGYGDSNWSDKLTSYNGQTISYDESGNPTSYKGATITWNGRLMTSYTKGDRHYEFAYNSDGMRTVKKVYENGELIYTYTYIWDGDVLLGGRLENADGEKITVRYLYDDSGELYAMDYNGKGYFAFIKNLQGDIVSIVPLDSESNVELNMEYDAWGKPIFEKSSFAAAFIKTMIMAATNVAYRGYFYDFDTGLYYLRSRYYDPETGRFINADDMDYLGKDKTSLSLNIFAYCLNNSVNYSDANGEWALKDHSAISKKISMNATFRDKVDFYNRMCDNNFATTKEIKYPFHSRDYKVIKKSVVTLFNLAISVSWRTQPKLFKYDDIFKNDGFTCYDRKNKDKPNTTAAKNANKKILNQINKPFYSYATGSDQAAILLGFCLHMIQDYYAHRIFVKVYSKKTSYDSKGFKGIATIDEQVYNKYKKDFKRCSIEDNVNVFNWRYTYAIENSKTLINMYSRKQKLKSIDFEENKNKNINIHI